MPVPWAPEPGSPPQTRVIRRRGVLFSCQFGFTPAYAGNTLGAFVVVRAVQVHPRIRGEYFGCGAFGLNLQGSPPHTRGIHKSKENAK